jgi:phosphoribosylformylglycinamidine synthase
MALAAIDECVRNLVCVGADPERIAILDNFCWPSCKRPENLGSLVRAAEGCYDGAVAYRTPFVSGKDSLNNQFTTRDGRTIEIPPTLLITGIGIVPDVGRACTMDAKRAGSALVLVGDTQTAMGGSHYQRLFGTPGALETGTGAAGRVGDVPRTDLVMGPRIARAVAGLIRGGLVLAAHDVSDGGVLCAVAEMLIAGSSPSAPLGARVDLRMVSATPVVGAFGESPSRYLLEVGDLGAVQRALRGAGVPFCVIGEVDGSGELSSVEGAFGAVGVERMAGVWGGVMDW